jgi:hypothetical protein
MVCLTGLNVPGMHASRKKKKKKKKADYSHSCVQECLSAVEGFGPQENPKLKEGSGEPISSGTGVSRSWCVFIRTKSPPPVVSPVLLLVPQAPDVKS